MKGPKNIGTIVKAAGMLFLIAIITVACVLLNKGSLINTTKKYIILEQAEELLQLDIRSSTYIGTNNKQIVKITKDGISAYDIDGEELWSDTLNLDNFIVTQRDPYIAVANKMGNHIIIFSDKGRQGEIICENPIVYFSINQSGSVAIIESQGESHIVSAYNSKGEWMGVKRVSYIKNKNSGYPVTAEISPNNKVLLVSYIDIDAPILSSNLIAIAIERPREEKLDEALYSKGQKDNFVYEIEFIKENVWVSIGDKETVWYTLDGEEVARQSKLFSKYTPHLVKLSSYGDGFLPVITASDLSQNTIHKQNELSYYNVKGEQTFNIKLGEPATYFYADDRGVIVGQNNLFIGYNKLGTKIFEFTTVLDVSKVLYFYDKKRGIAVTKDKVILLVPKKEVK